MSIDIYISKLIKKIKILIQKVKSEEYLIYSEKNAFFNNIKVLKKKKNDSA